MQEEKQEFKMHPTARKIMSNYAETKVFAMLNFLQHFQMKENGPKQAPNELDLKRICSPKILILTESCHKISHFETPADEF